MRTLLLISVLTLILFVSSQAQTCLPSGITLTSQAEVDLFTSLYPNCHKPPVKYESTASIGRRISES